MAYGQCDLASVRQLGNRRSVQALPLRLVACRAAPENACRRGASKPGEFRRIGAQPNVEPKAARVKRVLLLDRGRVCKFMHKLLTMINVYLSTILYGVSRLGDPGWIGVGAVPHVGRMCG